MTVRLHRNPAYRKSLDEAEGRSDLVVEVDLDVFVRTMHERCGS